MSGLAVGVGVSTSDEVLSAVFLSVYVDAPPSPNSPFHVAVGSTWVTLGWSELSCDGGHTISALIIRYKEETNNLFVSSYRYLYNLDPTLRNYTIYNLEPDTPYTFAVQAISAEFLPSPFSDESTVNTLLPGNHQ